MTSILWNGLSREPPASPSSSSSSFREKLCDADRLRSIFALQGARRLWWARARRAITWEVPLSFHWLRPQRVTWTWYHETAGARASSHTHSSELMEKEAQSFPPSSRGGPSRTGHLRCTCVLKRGFTGGGRCPLEEQKERLSFSPSAWVNFFIFCWCGSAVSPLPQVPLRLFPAGGAVSGGWGGEERSVCWWKAQTSNREGGVALVECPHSRCCCAHTNGTWSKQLEGHPAPLYAPTRTIANRNYWSCL